MIEPQWIVAILGISLAGLMAGLSGLGFALIGTAVLTAVLDVRTAAVVVVGANLVTSTILLVRNRDQRGEIRRLLPILVPLVPAVYLGAYLLVIMPDRFLLGLLGLLAVWFVVSSVRRIDLHIPPGREQLFSPAAGAVIGVLSGTIGVTGPVVAMYVYALALSRDAFVFSVNFLFEAMHVLRIGSLASLGQFAGQRLVLTVLLSVPAVVGLAVGMFLQPRLDQATFKRIVQLVIGAMGIQLLVRALWLG